MPNGTMSATARGPVLLVPRTEQHDDSCWSSRCVARLQVDTEGHTWTFGHHCQRGRPDLKSSLHFCRKGQQGSAAVVMTAALFGRWARWAKHGNGTHRCTGPHNRFTVSLHCCMYACANLSEHPLGCAWRTELDTNRLHALTPLETGHMRGTLRRC